MHGMMEMKWQGGRKSRAAGMRKPGRLAVTSVHGEHGRFLHEAVLPLRELALSLWPARDRLSGSVVRGKRLDESTRNELLDRLRRVGSEPVRPARWWRTKACG